MRKARTSKTIRMRVAKILAEHGIDGPPIPIEKLARDLGALVRHSPFEGELAGMLIRKDDSVIIGVNSLHHPNRQRFTIAHEIGHLLLHKGETFIDKTFINRRDQLSSTGDDVDEIEANRFAAELLMPYDMLLKDLDGQEIDVEDENQLSKLASKYRVSLQSITIRISDLLDLH